MEGPCPKGSNTWTLCAEVQDFSEAQVTIWAISYCHYQYHWFERLDWLRLYHSAPHSQVIEDATKLPFDVGRWSSSWRLLLVSCRCNSYLKARNNGTQVFYIWLKVPNAHMFQGLLSQWPGVTISMLLESAGKIEMTEKVAIYIATFSYI